MAELTGKFTILGCGNSFGVPTAAGNWGNCDPNEPKNRRKRCSALIQYNDQNIIIDTGPDFREQCLEHDIDKLDAVIYTHYHGDHANGIEDLRAFFHKQNDTPIKTLALRDTIENLAKRFEHCYKDSGGGLYKAILSPEIIDKHNYYQPYTYQGLNLIPFPQDHNTCETLGIRIGDLAYSVDVKDLNSQSVNSLKGVKTWIVDAADAWHGSGLVHYTINQIIEVNKEVQAKEVILTSLKPNSDYNKLLKELQYISLTNVTPAYDGLEIEFKA